MEAELEEMLVVGWFQGERAKLLLRVESLERELSCMASGRVLQQQAFGAQKEELSSRATKEEMLRRICERRVQDLEREVMLLSEQLRASGTALRRETANNYSSRQYAELASEDVPTPAERNQRNQRQGHAVNGTSYDGPSVSTTSCSAEFNGLGRDTDGGMQEVVGQLGVVGRLLEENLRLGSVVRQLQSEGRRLRKRREEHSQPTRATTDTTTTRPRRKGVVGGRGICLENVETGTLDLDMALSKIKALTGMIHAQEEIEALLGQELELKSKQAGNRENLWRLLTRWSRLLKKRGYEVERDARSEGIFQELQQRTEAENRELQDWSSMQKGGRS